MRKKNSFTKQHKSGRYFVSCLYELDLDERIREYKKTLIQHNLSAFKFIRSMKYFQPVHMSINQENAKRYSTLDTTKHRSTKKRFMKKIGIDE